jgi:hypothetical protein
VDDGGAVHVELDFFVPGYPKAKEVHDGKSVIC